MTRMTQTTTITLDNDELLVINAIFTAIKCGTDIRADAQRAQEIAHDVAPVGEGNEGQYAIWGSIFRTFDKLDGKATPTPHGTSVVEYKIVECLVRKALSHGFQVSVFDGEETPVKRSSDLAEIMDAIQSTDEDTLHFRHPETRERFSVYLVYGNGEDVISDHSDSELADKMLAPAMFLSNLYSTSSY